MKSRVSGINSLVLVLVALSSLVSMLAVNRIDSMVHNDLYRYDLQFSYEWALPYWTMTTLAFATCWFNIVIALAFQFYMLRYSRKEALEQQTTTQLPIEEKPFEAQEMVEELRSEEMIPSETLEAETGETSAPPLEVEMETLKGGEETETLTEAPQEYVEPEQPPEEAEEQKETVAPVESVEPEWKPQESEEEPIAVEERDAEEAKPSENVVTELDEPLAPPMKTEKTESPVETTLEERPPQEEAQEFEGQWEQEAEPEATVETELEPEEMFEEQKESLSVQFENEPSHVEYEEQGETQENTLAAPKIRQRPRKEKKPKRKP